MVKYIDAGSWVIAVECDVPGVHEGLELNFERRYSSTRPKTSHLLLRCRVVKDAMAFQAAMASVVFDGPEIVAGKGIIIRYGITPFKTWLNVTRTAIIELDESKPMECLVLLYPDAPFQAVTSEPVGSENCVACPEAFFYPMLVEWIRNFSACLVHCGAVSLNGRAVFLNGPPGSGKSTHVLRMLTRGAAFVADDLAFLHSEPEGMRLRRFREVANVNTQTLDMFPELSHLHDAPVRGDGKFCISIPKRFPHTPIVDAKPGIILRLHPGDTPSIRRVPPAELLDRMHTMAWFSSRPAATRSHFNILSDWLCQCPQWYVSRGYMRERLDDLMSCLHRGDNPEESA